MLGVEMVMSPENPAPNPSAAAFLHEALKEARVLVGRGGLRGNALRITPPLSITASEVDRALDAFRLACQRLNGGG